MIHGSFGAMAPWMSHHKFSFPTDAAQRTDRPAERAPAEADVAWTARPRHAGGPSFMGGGSCGCRCHQSVDAALFADRVRMDQRVDFRHQMRDIRHDIRSLLGSVEDGQLTADQQAAFDGYVKSMIDLREEFGIRRWHAVDADAVGNRILAWFGLERAAPEPSVDGSAEGAAEAGADAAVAAEETAETPETAGAPAEGGETPATTDEPAGAEAAADESAPAEAAGDEPAGTDPVAEESAPSDAAGADSETAVAVTDAPDQAAAATEAEAEADITTGEDTESAEAVAEAASDGAETSVSGDLSSDDVAALVDRLASTIVEAESLIDLLSEAIA